MITYSYPLKPINGDLLGAEVRAAGLPLISAGPPEVGVSVSDTVDLTFLRALTVGEQQTVVVLLQGHVAPPAKTEKESARPRARQLVQSSDPHAVLLRATLRVLFQAVKECRDQLGLPSRTWGQLLAAAEQQIETGGGDA